MTTIPRRLRGRRPAPGAAAPPGPRAASADPHQLPRPALRRRAVGEASPPGARRLRRHAGRRRASRCSTSHDLLAETVKDDARPRLAARPRRHRRATSAANSPEHLREFFDGGRPRPRSPATSSVASPPTSSRRVRHRGLRPRSLGADGFLLPPLPNHLFTRDTTCWVYGGVSLNPMAKPARGARPPTSRPSTGSTRCSPTQTFGRWYGGVDEDHGSATIEGGDVLVIGNGAVLVGMGERTTPQAVEALARSLFAARRGHARSSRSPCRVARAFMHLDTVMTMVRHDTFVAYPGVARRPAGLDPHPGRRPTTSSSSTAQPDVFTPITRTRSALDGLRVLTTGGDEMRGRARAVGRRQQRARRGARRRHRLRAQRRHQHEAPQGRHRGHHHRRQRARPRPWRSPLHELPARARRRPDDRRQERLP